MKNPTQISTVISSNREKLGKLKKNIYHKRLFIGIEAKDFAEYVRLNGEIIFRKKGENKAFDIDKDNYENLNEIFYYILGSKKFKGDLSKGLWLWSEQTGTGKTTILEIVCNLINDAAGRTLKIILAQEIKEKLEEFGYQYFEKNILFIDDLGRESKEVNIYGTKSKPMQEIIFRREKLGSWTFATCQRNIDSLNKLYAPPVISRMEKMFNQIEFKGKDRRK